MSKESKIINSLRSQPVKATPIATDMMLPNHSGDHSKGIVLSTPVKNTDIVNKAYVDSLISADPTFNTVHITNELHLINGGPIYMGTVDTYIASLLENEITIEALTSIGLVSPSIYIGSGDGALSVASGLVSAGTLSVGNGGTGATALSGIVVGNGASAMTAISNSSTVGQCLRVTGANNYAWGALDLSDSDARTGTLPMGNGGTGATTFTSGSVIFTDGSTFKQDNTNFYFDDTNNRLSIGGNTSPVGTIHVKKSNTDYTNTSGAGSHLIFENPSSTGQSVFMNMINSNACSKWRTDYTGQINWVAYGNNHFFFTNGDYGTGTCPMVVNQNGVSIACGANTPTSGYGCEIGSVNLNLLVNGYVNATSGFYFNGTQGYTGQLKDSNSNVIADVSGGIITTVYY